jgi:anti-sigma regulatory factor (Ser/Thr protein kinase)
MTGRQGGPGGGHLDERIQVDSPGRVLEAQCLARLRAQDAGFTALEGEEIALAAHELASNLMRHAGGGTFELGRALEPHRHGLELRTLDTGPGIGDRERAVADGFSTAGGLGAGLGTVQRLMDELTFTDRAGGGTRIVCRRWLRSRPGPARDEPLAFGAASRPRLGEPANGDCFLTRRFGPVALCGVIDGVGHGEPAREAAERVRDYLERRPDLELAQLFEGADRVARGSRGVVMALARFDLAHGCLAFASVGNVEARLAGEEAALRVRRGIVGHRPPAPVTTRHGWNRNSMLVLHSDGVSGGWRWHDLPEPDWRDPGRAARCLLGAYGKPEDDATVLVAKGGPDGE